MQHAENSNHCTPLPPTPSYEYEVNLLDILLVLAKRWKMITVVSFTVAVITAIITLFMPNVYTAKTIIIPTDGDSGGMGAALMAQLGGLAGLAGGSIGAKTTGDLYITMLKSEALRSPIIDKFKLIDRYKAKLRSSVYLALNSATDVNLGKKDGVITITCSDKDPKMAADLANEYVEQLGKLTTQLNMTDSSYNRIFLEKRIAEAKADVTNAEDALKRFQAVNKAISVTEQAKTTIEAIAQLRAQLAVQEVQLGTLQRQFTGNSQEVKAAKTVISNIRAQINSLEGKGGVANSSIPNLGAVPQLGQDYLRLMRELKIQEAVLEMLTKQYEMAKLSETKDTYPFQVLQKANVPDYKSKPKRAIIVIIAAFAAGFAMMLLAFMQYISERMNPDDRKRWNEVLSFLPNFPKPVIKLYSILIKN